ncbi:hypothetical protein IQ07DRAFT_498807, partial [Pyrenochaeta sp. DS3sAY3a]
ATQAVSKDARCGPSFGGRTCLGSEWGDCCSQYSYCGSTLAYCEAKTCQKVGALTSCSHLGYTLITHCLGLR